MRSLVKCEFYLMTLLAAVLFTVSLTAIGNQTDVSTETTNQMAKKPTVMILGSAHLIHNT